MSDPDDSKPLELLTFQIAQQEYALDIMSVREIRGWTKTTPLPHAPHHIKGVINLRGTVLPVMDLSQRLGMPPREHSERNVIIVVSHEGAMSGLLVDAVSDIVALKGQDLQPPPDVQDAAASSVVNALTIIEDRMIRVLDLSSIIGTSESTAA